MCTLYRNSEYQSTGYLNAIFTIAYRTQIGSPVSGKFVKETPCSESERGAGPCERCGQTDLSADTKTDETDSTPLSAPL